MIGKPFVDSDLVLCADLPLGTSGKTREIDLGDPPIPEGSVLAFGLRGNRPETLRLSFDLRRGKQIYTLWRFVPKLAGFEYRISITNRIDGKAWRHVSLRWQALRREDIRLTAYLAGPIVEVIEPRMETRRAGSW